MKVMGGSQLETSLDETRTRLRIEMREGVHRGNSLLNRNSFSGTHTS